MARKRITEYTAKKIIYPELQQNSHFVSVNSTSIDADIQKLPKESSYVVKVDQGIKKRMKKGLVKVKISKDEIKTFVQEISKQGYSHFFVEEFVDHRPEEEKFISLERTREGIVVFYSNSGGIHIEEHKEDIQKAIITNPEMQFEDISNIEKSLSVPEHFLKDVITLFEQYFFSFLEINPLVVKDGIAYILDLAVEVDSTAVFFVNRAWTVNDFVDHFSQKITNEEKIVAKLARESQAAFSLEVLNENGSIFVLLSGGGASLVIADEVYNLGFGKELANYGEYSGNPNAEETFTYTKAILSLLVKSKAAKKVLIIGGGVANFTDIRITFKGVIKALEEFKFELRKQSIYIFVRRGGPHQKEGLEMMKTFLTVNGIKGEVYGPDEILTSVVEKSIKIIK